MVRRNSQQQERMRKRIAATRANCHICGGAIDYDLKWPDPMCFVVDHVIPIQRGGYHELSNAKAAHNSCRPHATRRRGPA